MLAKIERENTDSKTEYLDISQLRLALQKRDLSSLAQIPQCPLKIIPAIKAL